MEASIAMAYSKSLAHLRDVLLPARTPGGLGMYDWGDPSALATLGDTPGSLGVNDWADPRNVRLPGLATFSEWAAELRVHIPANLQVGYWYPPGKKEDVLAAAQAFLVKSEDVPSAPYWPGNPDSGITIGVGYDLGQHSEKEIRATWSELDRPRLNAPENALGIEVDKWVTLPSLIACGKHGNSEPKYSVFTPLDRLSRASHLRGQSAASYLQTLNSVHVPKTLSVRVFKEVILPAYYTKAGSAFYGLQQLPTGVQVALISLVYNRGTKPSSSRIGNDIFNRGWEMRELQSAVLSKDLVMIYWLFESMRRIWVNGTSSTRGLVKRRNDELKLIEPYVIHDIRHQAVLQRYGSSPVSW